jgi:hypothetical protein
MIMLELRGSGRDVCDGRWTENGDDDKREIGSRLPGTRTPTSVPVIAFLAVVD